MTRGVSQSEVEDPAAGGKTANQRREAGRARPCGLQLHVGRGRDRAVTRCHDKGAARAFPRRRLKGPVPVVARPAPTDRTRGARVRGRVTGLSRPPRAAELERLSHPHWGQVERCVCRGASLHPPAQGDKSSWQVHSTQWAPASPGDSGAVAVPSSSRTASALPAPTLAVNSHVPFWGDSVAALSAHSHQLPCP